MVVPRTENQVLAGWAHDLGKPLLVIGHYARQLADEVGPDPRTKAMARSIAAMSDDALNVVDRLMESARSAEQRVGRSDRLAVVLHRVIAVAAGLHPGCRLRIRGMIPGIAIVRSGTLYSVLVNLVDNAIRASKRSQAVMIEARSNADELVIDVIDRGLGMSKFVRERAFDPYFSTQKTTGPCGLGLAESWQQIESMGGRIELESVEARGTRASVILPVESDQISSSANP